MQPLVDTATPLITFVLLVAVGLDLTAGDFRRVREQSRMVVAGVLLPPLLLPPLAIALIHLLAPSEVIAAGLLLLVVCPIGGLSNTYSLLARASTALSVTLTTVSCAVALVTIPAATALLELVWHQPFRYSAPVTTLVLQLLVVLVPPVAGGMVIRARWPEVATRRRPWVFGSAFALLAVLLLLVIASGPGYAELGSRSAVALAVAFVASAFVLGGVIAWLLRGTPADRFTFSAEFATRNVAVALAIAMSFGGHREFVWFAALYLVVEIPLLVLAALVHRRLAMGSE